MRRISLVVAFVLAALCCAFALSGQQAPRIRTLSDQEVSDALLGASIQATRNGDSAAMIKTAKALLAEGKKFTLISADDVPDDWNIVSSTGGVGGGGAWDYVKERVQKQNLATVPDSRLDSVQALSNYMGKKFNAIVRNEADGAMLAAFQTAAEMNIPVVDACLAGRAKPELNLQVPVIFGIPGTPAALVTRWGDTIIIDKAVDDYRLEDIARAIAVASGGGSAIARNPMTGKDVKRATIKGAVTEAILFGRTVREAREQGKDPIEALLKVSHGYKLFQGTVTKAEHKGERGFDWTDAELTGVKQYAGHTYRIYAKNENIISWLDGKPDVLPPDLIYDLDSATGDAITGGGLGGYPVGRDVTIIGRPANAVWRTPKGIEVFGPRHFGFDLDYEPLEQIAKTRMHFVAGD